MNSQGNRSPCPSLLEITQRHKNTQVPKDRQYLSTETVNFSGCSFVSEVLIQFPYHCIQRLYSLLPYGNYVFSIPKLLRQAPSHTPSSYYYCLLTHEDFSFFFVNSAMLYVVLARGIQSIMNCHFQNSKLFLFLHFKTF